MNSRALPSSDAMIYAILPNSTDIQLEALSMAAENIVKIPRPIITAPPILLMVINLELLSESQLRIVPAKMPYDPSEITAIMQKINPKKINC